MTWKTLNTLNSLSWFSFFCLFFFNSCVCSCVYTTLYMGAHGGQMSVLDLWELEFQAVVSSPTCMLGTEARSSGRTACALSHGASSPEPSLVGLHIATLHLTFLNRFYPCHVSCSWMGWSIVLFIWGFTNQGFSYNDRKEIYDPSLIN